MCGVPYHSARPYIAKLLEAGVKVAICEQIDVNAQRHRPARGHPRHHAGHLARRGDARRPTAATSSPRWSSGRRAFGLAWTEFSTGEVRVDRARELRRPSPRSSRPIGAERAAASRTRRASSRGRVRAALPRSLARAARRATRCAELGSATSSVPRRDDRTAPRAARRSRALVGYLDATQGGRLAHLQPRASLRRRRVPRRRRATTRRNLELVESVEGDTRRARCSRRSTASVTAMGGDARAIGCCDRSATSSASARRLDAVEWFVERLDVRGELRSRLARRRRPRATRRPHRRRRPRSLAISCGSPMPRDAIEAPRRCAGGGATSRPRSSPRSSPPAIRLPELASLLRRALVDEPPAQLGRGPLIREGYDAEIDRLRAIRADGKGWMAGARGERAAPHRHPTLKVGYNKVFGYYIEVTKTDLALVPADYVRKQTVATGERYVTDELKRRESELLGAEARLDALETRIFRELVAEAARSLAAISRTAAALAELDVLAGFAETAHARATCGPSSRATARSRSSTAATRWSRRSLGQGFVPNDCRLGPGGPTSDGDHRAEHGRQVDVHAPGRAHRAARADGQLRARRARAPPARRSRVHARRRHRQPRARPVDVHGRDDARPPHILRAPDRAEPGRPRRDRPRHVDVRRHLDRVGGGRGPARAPASRRCSRPTTTSSRAWPTSTPRSRTSRWPSAGTRARSSSSTGSCRERRARATASRWPRSPACRARSSTAPSCSSALRARPLGGCRVGGAPAGSFRRGASPAAPACRLRRPPTSPRRGASRGGPRAIDANRSNDRARSTCPRGKETAIISRSRGARLGTGVAMRSGGGRGSAGPGAAARAVGALALSPACSAGRRGRCRGNPRHSLGGRR